MKKYLPFLALILAFLAIALLKELSTGKLNYPLLVTEIDGDIRMTVLNHGQKSAKLCTKQLSSLINATLAPCPQCKIIEATCLNQLDQRQQEWLHGRAPASIPLALTQQGVIAYQAGTPAKALFGCQATEAHVRASLSQFSFICLPPGQTRPAGFGFVEKQKSIEGDFSLLLKAIATLLTLLGVLIITTKIFSKKSGVRSQQITSKLTLAVVDTLVMLAAIALLAFPEINDPVSMKRFDTKELLTYITLTIATVAWFWVALEHYARRRPFWDELRETLKVVSVLILLGAATIFYGGIDIGRGRALWVWGSLLILLPMGRSAAKQLLDLFGLWKIPAVIIGTGENAKEAYLAIREERNLGYDLVCFINQGGQKLEIEEIIFGKETYPVISKDNLISFLDSINRPTIIVALESLADNNSQRMIQEFTSVNYSIHVVPALRGLPLLGTQLSHFFSHEVLLLTIRNNLSRRSMQWSKRIFDITVASLLLVILMPLMLYVGWRIWREDGGPVIFHQPRQGKGQREFGFLKFRSMVRDADEVLCRWRETNSPEWQEYYANNFKLKNDPRVLSVGSWIRATSIDELPQLINVLRGEMSLVGPRPLLTRELPEYGESIHLYRQARPGLTGLWQISGRSNTTFSDRANLDEWYVQNWSLWYDIAIMFKTIDVVFNKSGAH
jgi:Undecaprenyl-phosphate galactose phosphotransferase WbaP